ncbi:MAG: OmpA family protein, partial [Bacteroidota bacterium]|nr:OmpA family protein [Bacteroidota bacterium]
YSIEKFPETINSKYKESSAVLSPDGNTLYFVSNKTKKSFGGNDIYYSRKDDEGKWEKPVNIGDSINTEYNEDGLYLHPSGKILYFSSQGHNSMGDYDIFISIKNNEGLWSKARNIGYPINSVFNDIHYVISGNGEHAYFASDREGGEGMFDIYKTTTQSNINYLTVLTGIVSDFENNKTLAANVQAFSSDNKLMCNCETDSSGKYQIMVNPGENHTFIVSSTGYMVHSVSFDIPKPIGFDTIRKDIKLMKTKKGNETVLGAVKFKYASSDLTTGSYTSLNKTAAYLKANPEMKVEISGHTDNTGTYEYNKELSENRAKAVVNYLISQNVPEDQMTYKGYAYDKPIASNDTNEGRQKNRRVELKIIE